MPLTYKTITSPAQATHRVLGSKHMAFAFPVKSESEIKLHLEKLKKEYHDATHICYAWRLGWEKKLFRHSDAGEPSGTAGRPIFGQIQSHDLTDVLIAVIRYFGGTKLGTGGLAAAYKTAASLAIESATVAELEIRERILVSFPFEKLGAVMKVVKARKPAKISLKQGESCELDLLVPKATLPEIFTEIAGIEGARAKVSS